jgi:hypothetical protein
MRKIRLTGYALLLAAISLTGVLPLSGQSAASEIAGQKTGVAVLFVENARDPKQNIAVVPREFQPGYHLFQYKCAECHSLNRSLRKTNLSTDEWGDIVFRMQDMASSHLKQPQSEAISRYLVWNDQFQQKAGKP